MPKPWKQKTRGFLPLLRSRSRQWHWKISWQLLNQATTTRRNTRSNTNMSSDLPLLSAFSDCTGWLGGDLSHPDSWLQGSLGNAFSCSLWEVRWRGGCWASVHHSNIQCPPAMREQGQYSNPQQALKPHSTLPTIQNGLSYLFSFGNFSCLGLV